jgi:hypothetical protein
MPRPGRRVTPHALRAEAVLFESPDRWFTSREVARLAKIAESTSRTFMARLAKEGRVEVRPSWPFLQYRARGESQ